MYIYMYLILSKYVIQNTRLFYVKKNYKMNILNKYVNINYATLYNIIILLILFGNTFKLSIYSLELGSTYKYIITNILYYNGND